MSESGPGARRPRPEGALSRGAAGLVLMLALGTLVAGPLVLDELRGLESNLRGRPEKGRLCSYRVRTGLPCIGCGGTRAFRLASRGEWRRGFATNVLGAAAGGGAWFLAAAAALSVLRGRLKPLLVGAGACAAVLFVVLVVQTARFLWAASVSAGS